jgi:hypothetical protein
VPLLDALAALPAEQAAVTLTYAELATLLGRPLPISARTTAWHWTGSAVARRNWIAAGWTARFDRPAHTVTFTRWEP